MKESAPSYRPVTTWSDGVRGPHATDALLNRLVEAHRRAVPAPAELALAAR